MTESDPIVSDGSIFCVDYEVKSFASHEVQSVYGGGFNEADFGRDYCEIVVFNLHEKRTNVETRVDETKAIFFVSFDVKHCKRRKG